MPRAMTAVQGSAAALTINVGGTSLGDTAFLELADGSVALIDPVDMPRVAPFDWQAPLVGERYVVGFDFGADGPCPDLIFLHRLVIDAEPDDIVMHRNGNTLDNRRDNLIVQRRLPARLPDRSYPLELVPGRVGD
jgi:hypothetical protein